MKRSGTPICLNRCNCELEKTPVRVNIRRGVINIANNPVNLSLFVFVHGCIQQIHYQSTWTAATCRFGLLYLFTQKTKGYCQYTCWRCSARKIKCPAHVYLYANNELRVGEKPHNHDHKLLKKFFGLSFHANFFRYSFK